MTFFKFWTHENTKFPTTKLSHNGATFTCGFFEGKKHLWFGDTDISVPLDDIQTFYDLEKRCSVYENGKVVCCRCHKIINPKTAQAWFSGRYCNDCWTEKDEEMRNLDMRNLD